MRHSDACRSAELPIDVRHHHLRPERVARGQLSQPSASHMMVSWTRRRLGQINCPLGIWRDVKGHLEPCSRHLARTRSRRRGGAEKGCVFVAQPGPQIVSTESLMERFSGVRSASSTRQLTSCLGTAKKASIGENRHKRSGLRGRGQRLRAEVLDDALQLIADAIGHEATGRLGGRRPGLAGILDYEWRVRPHREARVGSCSSSTTQSETRFRPAWTS